MPKINGFNIKVGADPELFVTKDGLLVSAHDLIPGTKKRPHPVPNGGVQVDGMALEFNINPVDNPVEWEHNINSVLSSLQKMVPDYDFFINPVAEFGEELIDSVPEEARRLGCEPDFNAYTKEANPMPNVKAPFRTASGHVHIGWQDEPVDPYDPNHFEACCMLTKMLDQYLAVPSFIWDKDQKRRELYGKAGAFRPKPYGMEYRVLSNKWLKAFPDDVYNIRGTEVSGEELSSRVRKMVYGNSIAAITKLFKDPDNIDNEIYNLEDEKTFEKISAQEIVNKGMVKNASVFIENYSIPTPKDYADAA